MNNNEFLEELDKQELDLIEKIQALQKVKSMFSKNGKAPTVDTSKEVSLGITDIIKKSFDDFPQVQWTVPSLKDELMKMRKKNLLLSESKNLLTAVSTPLQRLVENGYVRKIGSGRDTRYKKIIR